MNFQLLVVLVLVVVAVIAVGVLIESRHYFVKTPETLASAPSDEIKPEETKATITYIQMQNNSLELKPGDLQKLEFTVFPADVGIDGLTITSSNNEYDNEKYWTKKDYSFPY